MDRGIDTSRSLDEGDLVWVNQQLDRRKRSALNGAAKSEVLGGHHSALPYPDAGTNSASRVAA